MQHQELYRKYKTTYPPVINRWNIVWAILITALIEPFLMLRRNRQANLTGNFYWHQVEYFLLIAMPFVLILFWIYWREAIKRKRGYCWVGKFKVLDKQQSFFRCYLVLWPNQRHKLVVHRSLFNKTRVGDFIIVRRDALGQVEEFRHVYNVLARVATKLD